MVDLADLLLQLRRQTPDAICPAAACAGPGSTDADTASILIYAHAQFQQWRASQKALPERRRTGTERRFLDALPAELPVDAVAMNAELQRLQMQAWQADTAYPICLLQQLAQQRNPVLDHRIKP
ncbi:hypothetical protein MJ904_01455 [Massilia sp. MB5]|uniref:hypothetical protein n=1 Tax=Massilia sp. MB5 TaxID=2919578 RepID=UPI001F0F06FF|nr:hypothetical protein [Massilia sp. MB5]UMR30965.1 hypothetical protein MJ904_01455 [Massilia sp. MB5]